MDTFKNYGNFQKISLTNFESNIVFSFSNTTEKKVNKFFSSFSSKKATRKGDIFGKILKANINFYIKNLTNLISH